MNSDLMRSAREREALYNTHIVFLIVKLEFEASFTFFGFTSELEGDVSFGAALPEGIYVRDTINHVLYIELSVFHALYFGKITPYSSEIHLGNFVIDHLFSESVTCFVSFREEYDA